MNPLVKYAVTALLVVFVSEIAKRSDKMGALVSSLPLVTVLVMVWLYLDKQGNQKIGNHAYYTFWYVLPTLPMFLAMPWLLSKGVNFWISLVVCIAATFGCFILTALIAKRFGVNLFP